MTDNTKTIVPTPSISDAELQSFLEGNHAQAHCPFCRSVRWSRLHEPWHGFNYGVYPMPPVYREHQWAFEVVVMYCMQCGFVRHHAAHLIREWTKNHG